MAGSLPGSVPVHFSLFEITAMWLWTLNAGSADTANGESADEPEADDGSEAAAAKAQATGFVLEYDAARKIAQGLGAHLRYA
jgi:putative DNA methylase